MIFRMVIDCPAARDSTACTHSPRRVCQIRRMQRNPMNSTLTSHPRHSVVVVMQLHRLVMNDVRFHQLGADRSIAQPTTSSSRSHFRPLRSESTAVTSPLVGAPIVGFKKASSRGPGAATAMICAGDLCDSQKCAMC